MWSNAFPTRKMRAMIRAKLPPRAFLKIDRGDALFITNAPMFSAESMEIPGFVLRQRGKIAVYSPDESWLMRLERRSDVPPDELSATLLRFRGKKIEADAMALYIQALKLAERVSPAELELFEGKIRRNAALKLRRGGGGGLYGLAILNAQLKKQYNMIEEDSK